MVDYLPNMYDGPEFNFLYGGEVGGWIGGGEIFFLILILYQTKTA